jgi:hypothetical protein
MCMLSASIYITSVAMARVCISLPEELINDLKLKKPRHIGLSTHIRGLIYKALDIEYMDRVVEAVAEQETAAANKND